ncbi:hypothetical protein [Hyphomonas sp.]|uniref:hypothetical protein n=1 Tax=Hyphomonas sp. TaxID=87 RepID=UPI0025C1FA99|nr:hypothetical protein [Hyphomonas sp.]
MRFLIRFTVIGQHRSSQRKPRVPRQDEDVLTAAIIHLAERFGRYGYRRTNYSDGPLQWGRAPPAERSRRTVR